MEALEVRRGVTPVRSFHPVSPSSPWGVGLLASKHLGDGEDATADSPVPEAAARADAPSHRHPEEPPAMEVDPLAGWVRWELESLREPGLPLLDARPEEPEDSTGGHCESTYFPVLDVDTVELPFRLRGRLGIRGHAHTYRTPTGA
jgi:hypothetical protein